MKEKNAFEVSGNSPTVKVSESGAPIQTGRGLEETKRWIIEAFERIRQHPAGQHLEPPISQTQIECAYTRQQEERFQRRVKRLTVAALSSSYIMKATHSRIVEITVPTESAEDLIAEALKILGGQ